MNLENSRAVVFVSCFVFIWSNLYGLGKRDEQSMVDKGILHLESSDKR